MAEIMGTVTSVKRYLSPEKIELKISPDLGGESIFPFREERIQRFCHLLCAV